MLIVNSVNEIFKACPMELDRIRACYLGNCLDAAIVMKDILNKNGVRAEILTFRNGNDWGIRVFNNTYTFHCVTFLGDTIIDVLHSDNIFKTKDYVEMLLRDNSKLRVDISLSTGWQTNDSGVIIPSVKDLLYKNF